MRNAPLRSSKPPSNRSDRPNGRTNSALQRQTREMVQKRYFFHVSGFDPYDLASLYRRFMRETVRFAATWNVPAAVSAWREPRVQDSGVQDARAQEARVQ